MDCLKGYIGVMGCGAPGPVTETVDGVTTVLSPVLYINQLPGISLKRLEKLADAEQQNFLGVWADIEKRVLLKFGAAFRGRLGLKHSIYDNTVINCLVCSNKSLFSVALWYLYGVEVMIENTSTDRLNKYTTGIGLEQAEKLKADYYTEYEAAMNDAFGGFNPQGSDCVTGCVEVNRDIMFVEASL